MRLRNISLLLFFTGIALSSNAQTTGYTGTVTNQAFSSPNARYQLSIEELWSATMSPDGREMVATMHRIENGKQTPAWKVEFKAHPVRFWLKSEVIVSDAGDFALIPYTRSQWTLLRNGKSLRLTEKLGGSARQPGEKILEVDDNALIRIWNRQTEKWNAYSLQTETIIQPTPDLIQEWNARTRENILQRIRRAETQQLRKKLGSFSEKLPAAVNAAIPYTAPGDVRETFLEFLALQHNPEDRVWFEKLLHGEPLGVEPPVLGQFLTTGFHRLGSDPYVFIESNDRQIFGDALLAIFEGKFTNKLAYGKRPEKPFFLGKVSGRVRLTAPILHNAGFIRIHLVPQERAHKNWIDQQTVSLEQQLLMTTFRQFDLSDELSFAFESVPPGKFLAKAIWDKRRPFSNRDAPGPGDYQSDWIGPIEVKPSAEIKDVFIDCDLRGAKGEEYYTADRLAVHQWKKTGELSLLSHTTSTDGRKEIMSTPFASCLVKTNFLKPGKSVEFTRIAIFAPTNYDSGPLPLTILWRHGITQNGRPAREPMQICILDQHGCQFVPDQIRTTPRTEVASFPILPRSEETWRLVGYGPTGEDDLLFDYTIKNPVRRAPSSSPPQTLPLDLDLTNGFDTLRMHITRAVILPKSVMLEANFSQNGLPRDDWTIGEVNCFDADGNTIFPTEGCRHKKTLRLTGAIHHKVTERTPIPFALTINSQ